MSSFPIVPGRIVWAEILDPQKRNRKKRRCVVIRSTSDVRQAGKIRIVGITSELTASPIEHCIALQYGPNCRTGLHEESIALGTWIVDLRPESVESTKWFVRPIDLEKIEILVARLAQDGFEIPLIDT